MPGKSDYAHGRGGRFMPNEAFGEDTDAHAGIEPKPLSEMSKEDVRRVRKGKGHLSSGARVWSQDSLRSSVSASSGNFEDELIDSIDNRGINAALERDEILEPALTEPSSEEEAAKQNEPVIPEIKQADRITTQAMPGGRIPSRLLPFTAKTLQDSLRNPVLKDSAPETEIDEQEQGHQEDFGPAPVLQGDTEQERSESVEVKAKRELIQEKDINNWDDKRSYREDSRKRNRRGLAQGQKIDWSQTLHYGSKSRGGIMGGRGRENPGKHRRTNNQSIRFGGKTQEQFIKDQSLPSKQIKTATEKSSKAEPKEKSMTAKA